MKLTRLLIKVSFVYLCNNSISYVIVSSSSPSSSRSPCSTIEGTQVEAVSVKMCVIDTYTHSHSEKNACYATDSVTVPTAVLS